MSVTIPWIQYTEPVVAQNHPVLADVTNRPLTTIFTQSGYDLGDNFYGFASGLKGTGSPLNVVSAPLGFVFAQTDAAGYPLWIKVGGGTGNTGWQALNDFTGYPVTTQNLNVLGNAAINGTTQLNLGLTVIGGNTSVTTLSSSGLATLNSLGVTNGATFNGLVTFNASIHGSLTPDVDATYNIGTASFRWNVIRGISHIAGTDNGSSASIRTQTGLSSTYGTDLTSFIAGDNQSLSAGSPSTWITVIGSNARVGGKNVASLGYNTLAGLDDTIIGSGSINSYDGTTGNAGQRSIFVGKDIQVNSNTSVIIGWSIDNGLPSTGGYYANYSVHIGGSSALNHSYNSYNVTVGYNTSISGVTNLAGSGPLTSIGANNTLSGAIQHAIIVGGNNSLSTANQIFLAVNLAAANATTTNALYVGGTDLSVSTVVVGAGDTSATPNGLTLRATDASGTNIASGNTVFQTSRSTGNATPAQFSFVGTNVGAPGSALQALVTFATLSASGLTVYGSITQQGNLLPSADNTYSVGTSALRWSVGNFSTAIRIGTTPATTGAIEISNGQSINFRNAANTGDVIALTVNASNNIVLGGTNTNAIFFNVGGVTPWTISSAGMFIAASDNTYDIGASGASRPRSLYVGTSGVFGSDPGGSGVLRIAADNTNGSIRVGGISTFGPQAVNTAYLWTLWGTSGAANSVHPSSATNITGAIVSYAVPSTSTASATGIGVGMSIVASAAVGQVIPFYLQSPVVGASATATTNYGIRIDNQGNAGFTTSYGLFINAQSGSTNTYAIYNNGGLNFFNSPLFVLGTAGMNYDHLVRLGYNGTTHPSTSVNIVGFSTDFTAPSTATGSVIGQYIRMRTAAASYTTSQLVGSQIDTFILGAGSTITTLIGYSVLAQSIVTGTSIGLIIGNITGGTTNYAIQTNRGLVQFGDVVRPDTDNTRDLGVLTTNRWRDIFAARLRLIDTTASSTMGQVTLVGGTKVVSTTAVTANSRIFLTSDAPGGTIGFLSVSARVAGTSFTIQSSNALDTSNVSWIIVEPA